MKVAMFSRVLFKSGVTTHIIDLTKEMILLGHQVFIFTAGAENPSDVANSLLVEQLKETGCTIVNIPFPLTMESKVDYVFKMFKSIFLVHKALKHYHIDIIHIHTPALSFIPVLLNRKFIKTIHVKDLSLAFLNRKATHEITISRETFHESKEKFGYTDDEVSLIFNGVNHSFSKKIDSNSIFKLKEKHSIPVNKIVIGIVGSIQYRKGHDILLKALSQLDDSIKNSIHLIILGDGGERDEVWLEKLILNYNLRNHISKFSFQNPKPFYDIMDILVLPSRLEGFPLVCIEAFLSEVCVIRSNVEGAYDQITHNVTGFLFENEKSEELKSILCSLIRDEKLRKSVATAGREYALEHFTSDKMAIKTLEVYKKILS